MLYKKFSNMCQPTNIIPGKVLEIVKHLCIRRRLIWGTQVALYLLLYAFWRKPFVAMIHCYTPSC
jgi:hypothetical protein